MVQYRDNALEERFGKNGPFVSLTNEDGKKWTFPVHHCRTGLEIYQPSGIKGRLLKAGLPLLCKTGYYNFSRHCKRCEVCLSKSLKELLDSLFETYEYAIFWGTPSTDKKITIQIFRETELLGYCKIGYSERVHSLFRHEKYILDELNQCGVAHVPQCIGIFPLTESATAFVQTTEKRLGAKTEHDFGKNQNQFLQDMYKKTRREISFEKTDFYDSIIYLQRHVYLLKAEYRQCVAKAAKEVLSKHERNMVLWGMCHRDFTPWNTCTVDGKLFAFDFEYALRYAPKDIDRWHFYVQTSFYERKLDVIDIAAEINKKYKDQKEQIVMYLLDNMSMYLCRGKEPDIATANWRANLLMYIQLNGNV